jgi:hypothetical protein
MANPSRYCWRCRNGAGICTAVNTDAAHAKKYFPLLGGVAGEANLLTGCLLELKVICCTRRQPRDGLKDRVLERRIAVRLKKVVPAGTVTEDPGFV